MPQRQRQRGQLAATPAWTINGETGLDNYAVRYRGAPASSGVTIRFEGPLGRVLVRGQCEPIEREVFITYGGRLRKPHDCYGAGGMN
jgi:hypothetical protein